jgi:hypothetical protein
MQVPTPVAGEGGWLYVLDENGSLSVLPQRFDDGAPEPTWSAALPTAFSASMQSSPTIACNFRKPLTHTGVLYLALQNGWLVSYLVDSKGLDPTAPWPKYGHDVRNTNNASVAIDPCP